MSSIITMTWYCPKRSHCGVRWFLSSEERVDAGREDGNESTVVTGRISEKRVVKFRHDLPASDWGRMPGRSDTGLDDLPLIVDT